MQRVCQSFVTPLLALNCLLSFAVQPNARRMQFPLITPNHVQLVSACYPPASALLTAGPEYAPNSQELSRLTYYAANRPGKIGKLGSELEKRVRVDCKKAAAGNTRARA